MSTLEETIRKLNHMKLYAMATHAQEYLSRPDCQDLSAREILGLLTDQEYTARENRKLKRRLTQARFKANADLSQVDYTMKRGLKKAQFLELSSLAWIGHQHNVLIMGPTGTGKSFLAQALAHQACLKGYSSYYLRLSRLLEELLLARAQGTFTKTLAKLSKFDVLILDDWGINQLTDPQAQDLLDVIEDRHESKSTIVTTQVPTDHWHEFIPNETVADALCDRLIHNAHIIQLQGESLRKLKAKQELKAS